MPLSKKCSKAATSANIREMIASGHPKDQAVAAALNQERKNCGGKKAPSGKGKPKGK